MARNAEERLRLQQEFAHLLRVQERLLDQLQRIRDEIDAPSTQELLRDIRARTGSEAPERLQEVASAVEEAVRALQVSDSEVRLELVKEPDRFQVEGIENLPPTLARFLSERAGTPGFSHRVSQDPVRGWIIHWKERAPDGAIRAAGQFYERPYAWLDD